MNPKNKNIKETLRIIKKFFSGYSVDFWLEAGTALSAFRDGVVFPWEHDIDIAIWKESMPDLIHFREFFENYGYKVIIQKNFPFIDNIIQLRDENSDLFDVDIYIYTKKDDYALMRWIHKPEGDMSQFKKLIMSIFNCLIKKPSIKWRFLSFFIPKKILLFFFKRYLRYHIKSSKCIFHKFPSKFFLKLKEISFYGETLLIPNDTESFLEYRYGKDWKSPDKNFNQAGRWRKSLARPTLEMGILPVPVILPELSRK